VSEGEWEAYTGSFESVDTERGRMRVGG